MSTLIWTFLALLGGLLAWEGTVRLWRWRAGLSGGLQGTPADGDRYYAPEAEQRREADAAAAGMRNPAEPRRRF